MPLRLQLDFRLERWYGRTMHFCKDELFAILALLPFCGVMVTRLKVWWHHRFGCKNHHEVAQEVTE